MSNLFSFFPVLVMYKTFRESVFVLFQIIIFDCTEVTRDLTFEFILS